MPKDNETLRQSCKKMKPGVMDMRAADVGSLKVQRNAVNTECARGLLRAQTSNFKKVIFHLE